MICAVIAGAVGGAIMGIGNAVNTGFANNGVLTIMSYWGEGVSFSRFLAYLIGICVAFFGAAVLTYLVGFEDDAPKTVSTPEKSGAGKTVHTLPTGDVVLVSPVEGEALPLSEMGDPVFSSGALGQGVAIRPTKGEVVAPADCTVELMYETKHAMGLKLDNGVEVLIHIGVNTVELKGQYFESFVKDGDRVKQGDKLVKFDLQKIKAAGYDPTVCLVVSNSDDYAAVNTASGAASAAQPVLAVVR